jgi:tetratricopeptide (TPR) repeat protein
VIAQMLSGLGIVSRAVGDLGAATDYHEESLAIHQHLDDRRGVAWALHGLGLVAQASGTNDRASDLFTEALTLARAVGDQENIVWLLYALGCINLQDHDLAGATARFGESAQIAYRLGLHQGVALNLDALATIQIQHHALVQAAHLLNIADMQWKHATSSYGGAADRMAHERAVAVVRAHMDASIFTTAWQAGQTLTLHQVLAEVLASAGQA